MSLSKAGDDGHEFECRLKIFKNKISGQRILIFLPHFHDPILPLAADSHLSANVCANQAKSGHYSVPGNYLLGFIRYFSPVACFA